MLSTSVLTKGAVFQTDFNFKLNIMYTVLSIILIVFAILQIILFFKVWAMTNNVKEIARKLYCFNEPKDNVRKALLLNDKDKAIEILKDAMAQEIVEFVENPTGSEYSCLQDIYGKYQNKFEKLGVNEIPLRKFEKASEIRSIID